MKQKVRVRKGGKSVNKDFRKMTDEELAESLRSYSICRKGEISDLAYAASLRIASLSAELRRLEDDRK